MQLTKHWAAQLDDYAIDLAWSPTGSALPDAPLLAAVSAAGPVSLFAATDGKRLHDLPGHDNGTNCLAWMPARQASGDGGQESGNATLSPVSRPLPPAILATGGQDGAGKFWDAVP